MSSTHVDSQGMRMSKSALDGMAAQVNGEHPPAFGVEHDVTLPPLGKWVAAHVEPLPDGEHQLVGTVEQFEGYARVRLPDGQTALLQRSAEDGRPFAHADKEAPPALVVSVDLANFASRQELRAFLAALHDIADFDERSLVRKSLVPIPELGFTLPAHLVSNLVAYLLAKHALEKIGDDVLAEVGKDAASLYRLARTAGVEFAKRALPGHREVMYVFEANGIPKVDLVARAPGGALPEGMFDADALAATLEEARRLRETHQAAVVQFLLNAKGKWVLNYFTTDSGAVVGTKTAYNRRACILALPQPGGGSLGEGLGVKPRRIAAKGKKRRKKRAR